MRSHRTDPKIDRIRASHLGLSRADAAWLASAADEVPAPAGSRLGSARFAHLVLTGADAGLVVPPGAPERTLHDAGTVLVLGRADHRELVRRRGRSRTVGTAPAVVAQAL